MMTDGTAGTRKKKTSTTEVKSPPPFMRHTHSRQRSWGRQCQDWRMSRELWGMMHLRSYLYLVKYIFNCWRTLIFTMLSLIYTVYIHIYLHTHLCCGITICCSIDVRLYYIIPYFFCVRAWIYIFFFRFSYSSIKNEDQIIHSVIRGCQMPTHNSIPHMAWGCNCNMQPQHMGGRARVSMRSKQKSRKEPET